MVLAHCAEAGVVTIAITGDPAPDGNGKLNGFGRPAINNAGQVGFTSQNFDTLGSSDRAAMNLGSANGEPLVQIARGAQTAPGGNGKFSSFSFAPNFEDPPALNNAGQFAFQTLLTGTSGGPLDDRGIYFGSGGPLAQVTRGGQPLSDGNGNFYRYEGFTMNSVGQVAFSATVQPTPGGTAADTGIYLGSSTGSTQKIVREGNPAPDGSGTYSVLGAGALSDSGKVAFYSEFAGVAANTNAAISLGSGTAAPIILARKFQLVPGGNGRFFSFGQPAINSADNVAFLADLNFTSGSTNDDSGVYTVPSTGGGPQLVVRENEPAPDGSGVFRSFSNFVLNNTDRIALHASISGSPGGVNDGTGVFLVGGGLPRRQVARRNSAVPGGGTFSTMDDSSLAFNNGGQVAFRGNFNGGGAGLFIGNGIDLIQIVRQGQSLAGGTVLAATLIANTPVSDDHRSAINEAGQVAFFAQLSNSREGVFVFTPVLSFQSALSGNFGDPANWTLGIAPGPVHEVLFNPATNLLLLGPATNHTIKSLQIGAGAGTATLKLQPNVTLTLTDGLTVAANGVLAGDGTIAGNVVNQGVISPGASPGRIGITGNLTQSPNAKLSLEIGGTTAGSGFDVLDIAGDLTLDGIFEVTLFGGFTPAAGDVFDLLNWTGTLTGTFAELRLPPGSWDASQLYQTGALRVVPEPGTVALLTFSVAVVFRRARGKGRS